MSNTSKAAFGFGLSTGAVLAVVGVVCGALYGCPQYGVYSATKHGQAELAQADQNRQISIAVSKSKAEAAQYEAAAEVTRASGVAKANQIIGDSLKNNEAYLRYLFVNNLADTKDQVIYVPTEANLPLLEATRSAPSK